MISIYNYFYRSDIYLWMDPVNPQYVKDVVFVIANFLGGKIYFIAFLQELQWIQDNVDI